MSRQYTVCYRFEDGDWLAEIAEIPQVHTFGRTLAKTQEHIRDALALWLQADDPASLDVVEDFTALPDGLAHVVSEANTTRQEATELSQRAQELTAQAARQLVEDLGMPVRDAARLLGVSHQRIHQLVHARRQHTA